MIPEGVSITVKVENYKEVIQQLDDIRRSADAVVSILSAIGNMKVCGGCCPYCGAKMDEKTGGVEVSENEDHE